MNGVSKDRRELLLDGVRVAGLTALGTAGCMLISRRGDGSETRWQLDPDKCIGCDRCGTDCVLDQSAVRCFQFYDICCYCEVCTGYFDPDYHDLTDAAENRICPTDAIIRTFIEESGGRRHYEYSIDADVCIGCGKCIQGCELLNGALFLQVDQARCVNCNECAISVGCPTQAFDRLPQEQPYRLKAKAMTVLRQKAKDSRHQDARDLLEQVFDE